MCGLVGMAGVISHEMRTRIFKDMLDVCQLRGRDSTGVIKVTKDNEYLWMKEVGSPAYLYDSKQYQKLIEDGDNSAALIGHCRAKTTGEVSRRNAHPFDYPEEGICGVHNGTLRGSLYKLDTYHHSKVDSDVLYGHLAKNGPRETFSTIEGAWACIWWDNDAKTLNFIRNDQRPLYFTWSEDKKTMFWASEIWMFSAVSRKIKLWDGGEDKKVFIELPINNLWSFRINSEAKGDTPTLSLRPIQVIEPEKKFQTPAHNRSGSTVYRGGSVWHTDHTGHTTRVEPGNKQVVTVPSGPDKGGEVVNPFLSKQEEWRRAQLERLHGLAPGSIAKETKDPLDDKLPENLAPTKDEKSTTPLSNVAFLNASVKTSDYKTPSTSTTNSSRNILSLPAKSSHNSPSNNNDEQSKSHDCCSTKSLKGGRTRLLEGVSFRNISGIHYITWNATGREFTAEDFAKNTGGVCSFCKWNIIDLRQVGDFVDENTFLCTMCITEPQQSPIFYQSC